MALVSSLFCSLACLVYPKVPFLQSRVRVKSRQDEGKNTFFIQNRDEVGYCALTATIATLMIFTWTSSLIITTPFTLFTVVITWNFLENKKKRESEKMLEVWPEVTDHLISALHSGVSLSEALAGLAVRGPTEVRKDFLAFREELLLYGDFSSAIYTLKKRFNSHGSDQILEAILLAKALGGSELLQIFRTLGEFLRQDLAARKEIEAKHGWIKNSAHLSAAAPWLLLLLLSSQPGTAQAFSQPSGILILVMGLVLTAVAYLWMGKLGQLPLAPRVFTQNFHSTPLHASKENVFKPSSRRKVSVESI